MGPDIQVQRRDQVERFDGEVVLGVDTHKDAHVAVVLTALGAVVGTRAFATTRAGYQELVGWASGFGTLRRAGVEGTGSYGAGLARALRAAGVETIEINRPDRALRRRRGKSDSVDAEAAARAVLAGDARALAKSGDGPVEALRVLKLAKDSATKARVQAVNQINAVLINADTRVRERLEPLGAARLLAHCAELDAQAGADATAIVLARLARRVRFLDAEIRELQRQITATVERHAPKLLQVRGIGPDSAATLLIAAGDNPHRLRSEAAFAALCGVSPVQASSGKTQRHRLNRGGDRQANAALFRAVLTGLRWDPRTRAYLERRTAEGLSKREIMRCLKRYLARIIYRIICPVTPLPAAP